MAKRRAPATRRDPAGEAPSEAAFGTRSRAWAPPVLTGAIAFAVYAPRVCPTILLGGDSATFVAAAATWGVPQPSGYPLLTTLGRAASLLLPGDIAWRVHVTSALYHALTAAVVAAIVHRVTRSRAAAIGGGLSLAFWGSFFRASLYAEAFPLNDLFTALALLAALVVHERARKSLEARESRRALRFLALTTGLAAAHHQMVALVAPAIAVLLGPHGWRLVRTRGAFVEALGIVAAPIAFFYGLLALAAARDPFANWGDVQSVSSLVHLATRQDYGGPFSPFLRTGAAEVGGQLGVYGATLWDSVGAAGLGLALLGVGQLARDSRRLAFGLVLAWAVAGPFFAWINVVPVTDEGGIAFAERFVTMSHVPLGVACGAGLAWLERLLALAVPPAREAVALVFVVPLLAHGGIDLRDNHRGAHMLDDLFANVEPTAMLLTTGDALQGAMLHACGTEGRCTDRMVFSPGQLHLPWRVPQLARRYPDLVLPEATGRFLTTREIVAANLGRRPIYVAPMLLAREPALRDSFGYVPEWLWLRVIPKDDLPNHRDRFVALAERFASHDGCRGCTTRRRQLAPPSLELHMPHAYAEAFVNHARIARLLSEDALAARLEDRARTVDPEHVRGLL